MQANIEYDPNEFSEKTNKLVMLKAEKWQCKPSDALKRLLDLIADAELVKAPASKSIRTPQPA